MQSNEPIEINEFDNHVSTTVPIQSSERPLQGEASNPKPKKQTATEPEADGIGERRDEFSTEDAYPDLEIVNGFEGNRRDGRTEPSAPNFKNNQNHLDNHVSTTVLNQTSERSFQEDQSEVSNLKTKKPRGPEPEVDGIGERGNELSTADVYPDLEIVNVSEGNSCDGRTESHTSAPNLKNNSSTPDKFPTKPTNRITTQASEITIPIGIRKIMYGLPNQVLDVDTLETLFNNTKKRSNVQMIIKEIYTTNIEGLRQQLRDIVTNYYKPPITNTKEDRDFVKSIEKFLTRF